MTRYIVTTENCGCYAASTKKQAKKLLIEYGSNYDEKSMINESIIPIDVFLKLMLENNELDEITGL